MSGQSGPPDTSRCPSHANGAVPDMVGRVLVCRCFFPLRAVEGRAKGAPKVDDVRDARGRTAEECWAVGDVFLLAGATLDGEPLSGVEHAEGDEEGHADG